MDIGQHFRIIWRRRVPILLLSLLIAGLVYLWSSRQASVYQAASQVNVDAAVGNTPNVESASLLEARTYAQLATSTPVLQDAIAVRRPPDERHPAAARSSPSATSSSVPAHHDHLASGASTTQAIKMNAAVGDALVDKVEADQAAALADDLEVINGEIERQQEVVDSAERGSTERSIQANVLGTLLQQRSNLQTEDQDRLEVLGEPFARARPHQPEAGPGRRPRLRAGPDRQLRAGRGPHRPR